MLQRKTPLKRTAFKRAEMPKKKPAAPALRVARTGRYTATAAAAKMVAKPRAHRNRRLLDLAERMPCLLRVPGVCNGDPQTTVAAHSNFSIHGKAGARKADDEWSVWSCSSCHRWLDQASGDGGPSYEEKLDAFMAGHQRQLREWEWIEQDLRRPAADRAAARWALDLVRSWIPPGG
jgi:hypothetical protein